MKQSIIPRGFVRISGALALAAALESATSDALAFNIVGDSASHRFSNGAKTVLSFTESGSLTVTGSGTIELLVVGGGGGGGALGSVSDNQGIKVAPGGGAGGLVHKESFAVSAGTYAVTVGAGGAIGANGGNSSVFSVTAYGGGYGGQGGSVGDRKGGNGGSGGGGNSGWATRVDGGAAIYGDEDNLGHDGSQAENRFCQGGGGGAGSSPTKKVQRNSYSTVLAIDDATDGIAYGGDGLAFDISGISTYYAGGGAAYLEGTDIALGGKGGGGNGNQAGTDGLGGGGGGGKDGGSGVVIVRYRLKAKAAIPAAEGGTVTRRDGCRIHTFTADGTFTLPQAVLCDILIVGGGGGGGELGPVSDNQGIKVAGGGGAGGLIYHKSLPIPAGTYSVTVGAGGAIGVNGGNSSVFGITAYGGGYGARGGTGERKGGDGGSGGGANTGWTTVVAGGSAIYGDANNLGHDGSKAESRFCCGGGGGAGGSPAKKVKRDSWGEIILDIDDASSDGPAYGGDGLACDITGVSTYYAGGGAAYNSWGVGTIPGGKGGGGNGNQAGVNGLGGGGGGGKAGGSGVVIIRYESNTPTLITFR